MSKVQGQYSPVQTPQAHPSRRENQSGSSTNSIARSERGSKANAHPAVESAVTRLLVAIKQLLESLTQWSQLKITEDGVSDVYVRLGNDFNAAVAAFSAFGIDMEELSSVPDDLRTVLEQCLAEDATPDNLAVYLPSVRQIITSLLQGLRGKQSIYRRIVSDHRHKSDNSTSERSENRSSRSERSSRRDTTQRSQLSRTVNDGERSERESLRRSTQTPSRRREVSNTASPTVNEDETFVGGFSPSVTATPLARDSSSLPNPYGDKIPIPPSTELLPPPRQVVESESSPSLPESTTNPNTVRQQVVPASVKRWSLVDNPLPTPEVVVEPSSPEHIDEQTNGLSSPALPDTPLSFEASTPPAVASSLAALKKSDTLERRASKRFSTYNISKMTGTGTRERSIRGQANRRSLAASSALTPGDLAVLTEVDDEEAGPSTSLRREGSARSRRSPTPQHPPVPPLPATPARTPEPSVSPSPDIRVSEAAVPRVEPGKISVFLQVGREVKKVTMEQGLSFASLRMLFVDKFSYTPGLENFPAIYIRDPSSGVQYELEDVDEVKEKCLLSLNIEPLDQIKQHIDTQISGLSQDLKELRQAVTSNNRQSLHINPDFTMTSPLAESTPAPNRPTDRQFQHVARRLSRFIASDNAMTSPTTSIPIHMQPQFTGQSLAPQATGGSLMSDYSNRVVTDLKTQFDEVQNLRRDLGIMRQLYTEFMKQTKDSLGTLRSQTQSVKQLANENVGGARGYIDSGKKKLDTRSQNVLTEVERLQDTVEGVKDDVLKRHITPKAQTLKVIKKDVDSVATELESLKEHIQTIKPMWKKTWEEELQNIVEEQQFLHHQEEFLGDLLEDHKAVLDIFGHVQQVINLKGTGSGRIGGRNRSFKPVAAEDGSISNVMLEIRGAAVDPDKRMKAIEANQKNRAKELASRSDDLQAELSDFVGAKRLKMTGGAEEAERVRQKRNDMTLKAMFTGGSFTESDAISSPEESGYFP